MFDVKHEITLKTKEIIPLFGEEYFADNSTFWNAHQTNLNALYERVINTGFPIKITDLEFNNDFEINTLEEFHSWLKQNHPFNFDKVSG